MDLERCSSSSTSEEPLGSAREADDFDDDDLEHDYESFNDFTEQASAASHAFPRSRSLWRPSRLEDSSDTFSGYLKSKPVVTHPRDLSIKHRELKNAPRPFFLQKESVELLTMANRLSPSSPFGGASMSVRLPSPDASQVTASMPPLHDLHDLLDSAAMASVPLNYSLCSLIPIGASADALHPQRHRRHLHHELMEPLSMGLPPPATQLSSATEFATGLFASSPPVYADLSHPPPLAYHQFMSMTPSPAPPPTLFGSVDTSFSRRCRAADQPARSAPLSFLQSGGFGGFLQQSNESLGFGSSDSGLFGASRQSLDTSAFSKLTHTEVLSVISVEME